MENNSIFEQPVNNPSEVLWEMPIPITLEEYIETAEAFKFLEGYSQVFFAWSLALTNFSLCMSEWNELPSRITFRMEKIFLNSKEIHDENLKFINSSIDYPLDIQFANDLSENYDAPDEILEGVLTAGDGSILYGDSNCGKTFFVIDIASAISLGKDWMGRKTETGIVLYLATESPSSVKRRLQAYQKYHNVRLHNFVIVRNPINLFNNKSDCASIVDLVKILEENRQQKVRLIVGDTLARLSAGANENAGTDMGIVVKHFDDIRAKTSAHFMLIHHSGKNAAAGARGWSGVRAAVETEIEVTDNGEGRCAEITKQRDLDSKGVRIGFNLEPVVLGLTKWGKNASSCIVLPSVAPVKPLAKKIGKIEKAIIEYFLDKSSLVTRNDIYQNLNKKFNFSKTGIYDTVGKLINEGKIKDDKGFLSLV